MILAASAYIPPNTCQGVRRSLQARLRQKLGNLFPTKCLGENIGHLTISGNPLKANLLEEKKLVDDMKLAVNMPVFLPGAAVTADIEEGVD